MNLTADVGALCWNAGRWTTTRTPTGCCAGPRRQPVRRAWTPRSRPWWITRAARCSLLAGPGTGKTTAIVEAVAQRITERRIDPERVLVLTFSRKAAQELRERITTRLRRTTRQPLALTFHSYAYALVRREFVLAGDVPPTLLSGPEQLLEVRRMLRSEAAGAEGAGAEAAGAGAGSALASGWRRSGWWCAARRPSLAGAAAPGPGHQRVRHRAARFPAPRGRARTGRPRPGPAGPRARPRGLGRRGRLPGPLHRALRPGPRPRLRLRRDRPDRGRAAEPRGDPRP